MAGENCKMEEEEQEEEEEEERAPVRCINKCGFFGSPATMNLCSKCYKDLLLHNNALSPNTRRFAAKHTQGFDDVKPPLAPCGGAEEEEEEQRRKSKRCVWCKKRVGLTGFSCRCGDLFCSQHRYSDEHDCPFDYKAAAREAIAKANPLVKPEKVEKI